jgi:cell shape-determining protein MreD
MNIIIITIGFILDTILSLYIPTTSYFIPLLTITNIYLIYNRKEETKYFTTIAALGLIYDLIHTNLLFYHLVIFLILAFITKIIHKNLKQTKITTIIYISIIIIIYEFLNITILSMYQKNIFIINNLLNKIKHSLLFNQIYSLIIYNYIKKTHKKNI